MVTILLCIIAGISFAVKYSDTKECIFDSLLGCVLIYTGYNFLTYTLTIHYENILMNLHIWVSPIVSLATVIIALLSYFITKAKYKPAYDAKVKKEQHEEAIKAFSLAIAWHKDLFEAVFPDKKAKDFVDYVLAKEFDTETLNILREAISNYRESITNVEEREKVLHLAKVRQQQMLGNLIQQVSNVTT